MLLLLVLLWAAAETISRLKTLSLNFCPVNFELPLFKAPAAVVVVVIALLLIRLLI